MSGTLHMIMGSADSFEDCCSFTVPGDMVLLVDTGVALLAHQLPVLVDGVALAALQADVAARGLERQAGTVGVRLIDDREWVKLVAAHTHTMSWK